jgi:S-layer like family, N-terminal region
MKTLNAKRIAAVVAGAALLGVGLAFAGPITFSSVPIISNSGQPVVQIVIGSTAQPWDGVTAANIAAAIGNLAYTSVPVTASVNQTQAQKVLSVSVSSSSYSLSNQQVWLNESGAIGSSAGTYVFSALIGSVLNGAVILNSPQNTKTLQGSGQYTFQHSTSLTISPVASPYTTAGQPPTNGTVQANNNGGGVTFSTFSQGGTYDNIMQITSSQYSGLVSNYGGHGESETLWVTGFPVFDQGTTGSPVNQFRLEQAGGAYQATFATPIQNTISGDNPAINVPIRLLGQNWTILNGTSSGAHATSTTAVPGGKIYLASALVPLQTLYVGHNITSGPWTVQLTDLGQPTAGGESPASLNILYNNVLTNTSSVYPGNTAKYNVSGHTLYVNVNTTFAGLYAYQKWAKLQLYTNVYEVQNGKVFNTTTNPGWYVNLLWTNTTSSSSANAVALQSIILYNATPTILQAGQSFNFIQNPATTKLTFLGESLGTSSFDSVNVQTAGATSVQYSNANGAHVSMPGGTITNITEPASELVVTSQIPNAFSYAGQTSSTATYDLTPYELNEVGNTLSANIGVASSGNAVGNTAVILSYTNAAVSGLAANWITPSNPLSVGITGYATSSSSTPTTQTVSFSTNSETLALSTSLYNVTGIALQRPLPGNINVQVVGANTVVTTNAVLLAALNNQAGPGVLYTVSGQNYQFLSIGGSVIYNQQNGQPTNTFQVAAAGGLPTTIGTSQYFTFTLGEQAVPTNGLAVDGFSIGLDNSTGGTVSYPNLFQLNYSNSGTGAPGTKNNVTYTTYTQVAAGVSITVPKGFRSEKGSQVVSISPTTDTFNLAKAQDWLQFSISASSSNTPTKSYASYGPYGVGQATNIPNVSIGKVTANISVKNANFTVAGIANLTATPSVSTATQPVLLKNLTTQPLVVLDSDPNLNSGSNLILIGSGFVNKLSGDLQASYNISNSDLQATPVAQAYGTNRILIAGYYANQTNAEGNVFIQQLYALAQQQQ